MSRSPNQNPSKAKAFKIVGWLMLIIGFLLAIQLVTILVAIVPVYIGYLLLRKGKKYSVETGDSILKNDTRPPILYLRSFQDEELESSIVHRFKNIAASDKTWLALTVPNNSVQEQDALGYVFRKAGPYIALGKPDEKLPELGSSKIYVPNESWQETILDLFKKARLVIFSAGKTEGLKWELAKLVQMVHPRKVLLILPVKNSDYLLFTQWANAIMPVPFLAEYPPGRMVIFNDSWHPAFLSAKQTLTKSLEPFFKQNGIIVTENYWQKILEHNGVRW